MILFLHPNINLTGLYDDWQKNSLGVRAMPDKLHKLTPANEKVVRLWSFKRWI
jgi:hypothetical protein